MIDCPICHVKNEEMARFCAECGQRLTSPPSALPESSQGKENINAEPRPKLHSPLLNADTDELPAQTNVSARKKLRSGNAHLHSPLLEGDVDEPANDALPDPPLPGRRGLRSPLLHSPILDGVDSSSAYDEAYFDDDDPNVLRSPLLAARVPMAYKAPEAHAVESPASEPLSEPLSSVSAPPATPASLNPVSEIDQLEAAASVQANHLSSKRQRFKLLQETEPLEALPPNQNTESSKSWLTIKFLTLPLSIAAIFKILTVLEFLKAGQPLMPVVFDQVGQLLVTICLIVICLSKRGQKD